jgi:hypothetical protein
MIDLLVSWAVTTALTFAVVVFDERRMAPERLARAWPPSSRDAAIVAFGPLAIPIHFAKTAGIPRGLRGMPGMAVGLVVGIAVMALVGLASGLAVSAIDAIFGVAPPS